MSEPDDVEGEKTENVEEISKKGFFADLLNKMDNRYPKIMEKLKDIRIQAVILFFVMAIFYINLIIWDFYFSADSMTYGLQLKYWFEGQGLSNEELFRPAHPFTMPIAILFTHLMIPIIGHNYLLSYAILDSLLGALAVSLFYLVCNIFIPNRKFGLICALGLAFSFTFWENHVMAEDRSLAWVVLVLYMPLVFSYVGEFHPFKWFEKLKVWQRGFVTGLFLGLVISVHFSLVLLILFTLILGWRYHGLKYFKSRDFFWLIVGCALLSGIVYISVAMALGVSNLNEFIGMFFGYYSGSKGSQFFALSDPGSFSLTVALRGMLGGVFTAFFLYISNNSVYQALIIGIWAVMILFLAFVFINERKNKVINSFFFIYALWFAHFIFFAPDDRNSWAFLLVPFWLSVCICMHFVPKEGLNLILFKRKIPDRIAKSFWQIMTIFVVILFVNNTIVFADAHFNRDEREKFVNFMDSKIQDEDALIIVDNTTAIFFRYYSETEAVNFRFLVTDPAVSDHVNESFLNNISIYVAEFWMLDSFIKVGSGRHEQSYDARLKLHREYVERFLNMYTIELAYQYEWSDVYRITGLK